MTRKDYELLAEALNSSRTRKEWIRQWMTDREFIMDALARDNPRFDRHRFILASERSLR